MKCTKFRKLLIPYSEGSLPEEMSSSLERHLAECESCARELRSISCTVDVLRKVEYPAFEPALDLRSRVLAQITEVPARKPWWQPARLQTYSAAMAGLLLVAIAGAGMWRMMERGVEVPAATQTEIRKQVEKAVPEKPKPAATEPKVRAATPQPDAAIEKVAPIALGRPVVSAIRPDMRIEWQYKASNRPAERLHVDYGNFTDNRWNRRVTKRGFDGEPATLSADFSTIEGREKSLGYYYGTAADESMKLRDAESADTPAREPSQHLTRSMTQSAFGGAQSKTEQQAEPQGPAASSAPTMKALATTAIDDKSLERIAGNGIIATPSPDTFGMGNSLFFADATLGTDVYSLETKLRDFPSSVIATTNLMVKYREAGRPRDEYNMAERLTRLDPDNSGYWLSRAQAADRVPMPKTALACYEHAVKLGLKGEELRQAQERVKALEAARK